MIGKTINGRYRVEKQVGEGGMGVVYQAFDLTLERNVAVKVLNNTNFADEGKSRLIQEAKSTARLNHANIVTVYDAGEVDGSPYIVMELVSGDSLFARPPKSLPDIISTARQLCAALQHAHDQGIIHRDIKPENVLITENDQIKLMDFGLARSGVSRLTQEGAILGSLHYLAPEQASGAEIDARADLYALGVMLYEFAAGELPFKGDDPIALIGQHLHQPPRPPVEINPDIPPGLNDLILRLLEKEPKNRPASAGKLKAELEKIEGGEFISIPSQTSLPKQKIKFTQSSDGVRLAYSIAGEGPPLVMGAVYMSHIEFDWESPVKIPWLREFSKNHTLIRYNYRGTGLSDWDVEDLSFEGWVRDLEAVVEAAGLERFPLLAMSQAGTVAVTYAHRHPEKVSRLVIHGGYARGWLNRDLTEKQREEEEVFVNTLRLGWGMENPAFRQILFTQMLPEATREEMDSYDALMRKSTTGEIAARLEREMHLTDVRDIAPLLNVPTLITHCREDGGVPFEEGRLLASLIPNAEFLPLESNNHLIRANEPAWPVFIEAVRGFLDDNPD